MVCGGRLSEEFPDLRMVSRGGVLRELSRDGLPWIGGSRSSSQILVAMGPLVGGESSGQFQKGGGSEALSLGGPQGDSKKVVEVRLLVWGVLSWGRKTWWKRGPLVWGVLL